MWGNELLGGDLCSPSAFLTFNLFFSGSGVALFKGTTHSTTAD